jgi:putative CocE/NonD family hydrolase
MMDPVEADALHECCVVKNVLIPMSDGVTLAADLVVPDAPGRFPAVFDYYPYRKDDTQADGLRLHRYLARRGYVALKIDVRGTGGSGGTAADEYVLREQLDAVEAIEWMARQPWCTGRVGMFGTSYGGFNSVQVAMHRPPALKAICPMYFTDNRYTDDCHYKGGALQMLFDTGTYGLFMVVLNALPPYPQYAGTQWAALWEEHLTNEPWMLRWLENQTYTEQWRHGSLCEDYEAIECAVFLIGGWRDGYTNCNLRTFERLRCPKKALIGPWLHTHPDRGIPGPRIDHLHEMVRFYDHWLKDVPNGVMEEPPITLYVQEFDQPRADRAHTSGFWRHEPGWPLARAHEQTLFLAADEHLAGTASAETEETTYRYVATVGTTFGMFSASSPHILPVDQCLEDAFSANFTSPALDEALEILGYPHAVLAIATTARVATVVARLIDVAPDGTAALVCKGVLNLTHRDSHTDPSPLEPGQRYTVQVPLDATSWIFAPGHRIRLALSGADFPNTWPSPEPYTATLYLCGEAGSCLVLPTIGPQELRLPVPQLRPPAVTESQVQVQEERPVWRVTHDHMAGTTEVFMRTAHCAWVADAFAFTRGSEMTATGWEHDPAHASMRGLSWVTLTWPDRTIETRARGQIESTADVFHVTIQLDITMDGAGHFNKRWVRSIPRHLL